MKKNFDFDEIKKERINDSIVGHGKNGHLHALQGDNFEMYKSAEEECLLLKVLSNTELRHEEHHSITLLPGNYKESSVMEFDHFREEARKVMD